MQNHCTLGVLWLAMGILLAAAGCGSGEQDSEPLPAAIKGTNDERHSTSARLTSPKPPQSITDPKHPVVVVETSAGDITVRLEAEKAPRTVENFLAYVREGHYDQTIFHRVIKNYVILGGTYTPELDEKKTRRPIYNEARQSLKNRRGTIAMARDPDIIDSATSQFFFNITDNPPLDHKDSDPPLDHEDRSAADYGYCAFGEITEGIDVIDQISEVPVQDTEDFDRTPVQTVLVKSIRIVR